MDLTARYRTSEIIELFSEELEAGTTGMNLKLIVDLIEWRLEKIDKDVQAIPLTRKGAIEPKWLKEHYLTLNPVMLTEEEAKEVRRLVEAVKKEGKNK